MAVHGLPTDSIVSSSHPRLSKISLPLSSASSLHIPSTPASSIPTQKSTPASIDSQYREKDDTVPLTTQLRRLLKQPQVFYPLQYSREMRDIEVWNNGFVQTVTSHPTLTSPELIPPNPVILDLACGCGHWCILAARYFKDCQITGLDIADIQPDLHRLGHHDIADKISWVHSDMLEDLPFLDNHFDLVRAIDTAYCIPEDKWSKLFEEIARILKPGGIFETAQGALTFPCPRFPPQSNSPKNIAADGRGSNERRVGISEELEDADPRDHSRLKAAFDAMVEVRFLNPRIISTIPFYLDLQFENVLVTPVINVMLPPSSFVRDLEDSLSGSAAEPKILSEQVVEVKEMLRMVPHPASLEVTTDIGGQMHLHQTLNIILASAEAIWEQFESLNPSLTRIDFDYLMKNWELDMRDRIDMRGVIKTNLKWDVPLVNDDPDQKSWRHQTLKFHEQDGLWDAQPLPELCRSVRVFRGVKPRHSPP